MSSNTTSPHPRNRRTSVLLSAALGLALSSVLVTPAWADTSTAPGQNKPHGQPCAGCVGKADDKSPGGQTLDGSDPNAGYECDTNKGVGPGNPAHTGCLIIPPGGGGGTL
jgi:hypothetical protein